MVREVPLHRRSDGGEGEGRIPHKRSLSDGEVEIKADIPTPTLMLETPL